MRGNENMHVSSTKSGSLCREWMVAMLFDQGIREHMSSTDSTLHSAEESNKKIRQVNTIMFRSWSQISECTTCSDEPGETTWGRSSNGLGAQRGLPRPLSGSYWLSKELETIWPHLTSVGSGQKQNHNPIEHCSWINFFGPDQHGPMPCGYRVATEESLRFLANNSVDFVFSIPLICFCRHIWRTPLCGLQCPSPTTGLS